MAQKSDFKTVETDLDELEEKIRKHRRKIAKRIIIVVAAVVALSQSDDWRKNGQPWLYFL